MLIILEKDSITGSWLVNLFHNSIAKLHFLYCPMFIRFGNFGTGVLHPCSQMSDFPTASPSGWLAFSTHTVLLQNGCNHIQRKYASLPLSDAEHNLSSRDSLGLCGGLCVPSGIWVDLKSEKPSNSFDCDFSARGVGFIFLFILFFFQKHCCKVMFSWLCSKNVQQKKCDR